MGDLHEALITRRDVAGTDNQDAIYSKYNCVIVHHACHMQIAGHGGDDGFERCARQIVRWEGYEPVRKWLMSLGEQFEAAALNTIIRLDSLELTKEIQHG